MPQMDEKLAHFKLKPNSKKQFDYLYLLLTRKFPTKFFEKSKKNIYKSQKTKKNLKRKKKNKKKNLFN